MIKIEILDIILPSSSADSEVFGKTETYYFISMQ